MNHFIVEYTKGEFLFLLWGIKVARCVTFDCCCLCVTRSRDWWDLTYGWDDMSCLCWSLWIRHKYRETQAVACTLTCVTTLICTNCTVYMITVNMWCLKWLWTDLALTFWIMMHRLLRDLTFIKTTTFGDSSVVSLPTENFRKPIEIYYECIKHQVFGLPGTHQGIDLVWSVLITASFLLSSRLGAGVHCCLPLNKNNTDRKMYMFIDIQQWIWSQVVTGDTWRHFLMSGVNCPSVIRSEQEMPVNEQNHLSAGFKNETTATFYTSSYSCSVELVITEVF